MINTLCSADPGLRRRNSPASRASDAGRVEIVSAAWHRSLSKADTGWPDYCQLACEVHFEQLMEPLAHERNHGSSSQRARPKQRLPPRVDESGSALKIGDSLVECEQDPIGQ